MPLPTSLCSFPLFAWTFALPSLPSLALPAIPIFTININLACPLD